jgi:twitching motility two-component system response regulator PilH
MKKILLVDDSPTERHAIGEILAQGGYQVITADSGELGVEKARTEAPDLVVMDVVMPGMNGFQACKAITTGDETRHIPVILCTTKNQETDKIWGARQGAIDYVTKPVDAGELLGKIAAHAGRQRTTGETA